MTTSIHTIENKKVEDMTLPEALFEVAWNESLVHQAIVAQQANARNSVAHAKDRSEVRGGGKKPWRQKGTGRARHGSIRSPLWSGGGATFGPRNERNFEKKINKKMRQKALFSVLSRQAKEGNILVIDTFPEEAIKTKKMSAALKPFLPEQGRVLVVLSDEHKDLHKGMKNLEKMSYCGPRSLNVYDAAIPSRIIFEKAALDSFISMYSA